MKRSKINKQKRYVSLHTWYIDGIRNPLPCVQLAAVKSNVEALLYIKKPCRAVQMYCIKKDPALFRYIENPHPLVEQYMLLIQL